MKTLFRGLISVLLGFAISPAVHAQWAVVDVGAIAQLVQQVATLKEQLDTARNQLTQAQAQYQSMTGARGMERLLSGSVRNYLPADWDALDAALHEQGGGSSALGREVSNLTAENAILSAQHLSTLSSEERVQLEAARRSVAGLQALSRIALQTSSQRFGSLQGLIDAIASTQDQKGALDLQARTASEIAMLSNDHMKLIATFQATQAEELARKQRAREQAILAIGDLRTLPPLGLSDSN